jgi:hypothetical protein
VDGELAGIGADQREAVQRSDRLVEIVLVAQQLGESFRDRAQDSAGQSLWGEEGEQLEQRAGIPVLALGRGHRSLPNLGHRERAAGLFRAPSEHPWPALRQAAPVGREIDPETADVGALLGKGQGHPAKLDSKLAGFLATRRICLLLVTEEPADGVLLRQDIKFDGPGRALPMLPARGDEHLAVADPRQIVAKGARIRALSKTKSQPAVASSLARIMAAKASWSAAAGPIPNKGASPV